MDYHERFREFYHGKTPATSDVLEFIDEVVAEKDKTIEMLRWNYELGQKHERAALIEKVAPMYLKAETKEACRVLLDLLTFLREPDASQDGTRVCGYCTQGWCEYHQKKDASQGDKRTGLVKHMVNRFLSWKLPEDFRPDAGISFNPEYNVEYRAERGLPPISWDPIGTNLLTATQAEEMVRYMLDGSDNVSCPNNNQPMTVNEQYLEAL